MRKQLTVFSDIDEVIEVRTNFARKFSTNYVRFSPPLNENKIRSPQ